MRKKMFNKSFVLMLALILSISSMTGSLNAFASTTDSEQVSENLVVQASTAPNSELNDSTGKVNVLHYDVSSLPNISDKAAWSDSLMKPELALVVKSGMHGNDNWTALNNYNAFLSGNLSNTQKNAQRIYGYITPDRDVDMLSINVDDGVRLYLDLNQNGSYETEELIIESWTTQSSTRRSSSNNLNLKDGYSYMFKLEYFNWGGYGNLNFQVQLGNDWTDIPSKWFSTEYKNRAPEISADDITLFTSGDTWDVLTGAEASDFEDDNSSIVITVKNSLDAFIENLDISSVGEYNLTYTATDSNGATATTVRRVNVVEAPKVPNLFITVDDHHEVYFNGSLLANTDENWKTVEQHTVTLADENLIAVKGWDRADGTASISGFIAKLILDNDSTKITDSTWMYSLTEPPRDLVHGKDWFEPGYAAGTWLPVVEIPNSYFTEYWHGKITNYTLLNGAKWIWTPAFEKNQVDDSPNSFDSPVWFRNIVTYDLTINYVDASGAPMANAYKQSHTSGSNYSVTSPVLSGYTADLMVVTGTMGSEPHEMSVVYTPEERTVTFDSNGGTSVAPVSVDYNNSIAKPTNPTKEGYTFDKWILNNDDYLFTALVTENITLEAVWIPEELTITFDSNGGTAVAPLLVDYNSAATRPSNPTRAGFTFSNWFLDESVYNFSTNVVKNITLVAIWNPVQENPQPPTPTPTPTPQPPTPQAPTVGISLDKTPVELEYGSEADDAFKSYDLTETITGSTDLGVVWTVSDPEIASVDQNGNVIALKQGETTVTVTHTASGSTASSQIIVFLVGNEITPLGAVEFYDPYILGYPDQTFGPSRSVSRAEVAAMFARILKLNLNFPGDEQYTDVKKNDWYFAYVQAASRAGLFTGYGDNSFKPNEAISRGEIATVFAKYWEFLNIEVDQSEVTVLKDVDPTHWASSYIYMMYNAGIVKGFEDGSYRADSNTLREQVVGMINTLIARPEYAPEMTKFIDITPMHWAYGNIEAATTKYSVETKLPEIDGDN